MTRTSIVGLAVLLAWIPAVSGGAAAQDLADFDYENLSFRGIGVEGGYLLGNNVEDTYTVGLRADLGFLGPGLRIVPGLTYWSSDLEADEIRDMENRLEELVVRESEPGTPRPDVNLSPIEWSDVVLSVDAHFVWSVPGNLLTYAGVGGSAHLLNGQGPAIEGTFIEDLLDSVRAGFNLHAGLEYPVHERIRLYSAARGELLGDLQYLEFRLGAQLFFGPPAPGEPQAR